MPFGARVLKLGLDVDVLEPQGCPSGGRHPLPELGSIPLRSTRLEPAGEVM